MDPARHGLTFPVLLSAVAEVVNPGCRRTGEIGEGGRDPSTPRELHFVKFSLRSGRHRGGADASVGTNEAAINRTLPDGWLGCYNFELPSYLDAASRVSTARFTDA